GARVALLRVAFGGQEAGTSVEMLDADSGETVGNAPVWSVSGGVGQFVPAISELAWTSDGRLAVLGVRGSLADLFILDPAEDWTVTTEPTVGHESQLSASPEGGWLAVWGSDRLTLWA